MRVVVDFFQRLRVPLGLGEIYVLKREIAEFEVVVMAGGTVITD